MNVQPISKKSKIDTFLHKNPFTVNLKIVVSKLEDKKTFQNNNGVLLHKEYYFEREQYIKIYNNPIHRKLIANLTGNTTKLLYWLSFELERNKDHIKINKKRCLNENKFSLNTYKKALTELQTNLIICASPVKDIYFINPSLIFSGNRIKHYPNNIQIYKPNKK